MPVQLRQTEPVRKLVRLQIVLPSNPDWKVATYFRLVEKHKTVPRTSWLEKSDSLEESDAKRPRRSSESLISMDSRVFRRSTVSMGGTVWASSDIVLAAKLFNAPYGQHAQLEFNDKEEERRVFTLVYDVLRYKSVLNQVLSDVYFYTQHPKFREKCHHVWLIFFDIYKRDFTPRETLEPNIDTAFHELGLHEIDSVLWQLRVRLAATVSRLRIKNGAHSLSQLLPIHLQSKKTIHEETIISGWMNGFKTNIRDVCNSLESMCINPLPAEMESLYPLTYKTDHILPRFIHILPSTREDIVKCPLILNNHIILQERSFCIGPAVIAQLLKDFDLTGSVAQTNIFSPLTTAYLANLLNNNEKIDDLIVFGAGNKKEEYEKCFEYLGITNIRILSEDFYNLPIENNILENVVGVWATPSNTNSSVLDPVDLAIARGGDLQILQQLTEDTYSSTPTDVNINDLLWKQKETLRHSMSKPQIQLVVYETHSRFECENNSMVIDLIKELNTCATEIHLEDLRKSQVEKQEQSEKQPETEQQSEQITLKIEVEEPLQPSIVVPPTDLFELTDLPELCPNNEKCLDMASEGTYIAVIKRKEITRLDPKYMIQMAEARGLFGRTDAPPKKPTPAQSARVKATLAALRPQSDSMDTKKGHKVKVEVDRIAAPTRASLLRDSRTPAPVKDICPRHAHHLAQDGTPKYFHGTNIFWDKRKESLTSIEEEELIKRLYLFRKPPPKINMSDHDLRPLAFWDSPISVVEEYINHRKMRDRLYELIEQHRQKPQSVSILQFTDDLFSQMLTLSASIAKAEKHIDEKIQKHKTDNPNR